jgi:hypothetical protein
VSHEAIVSTSPRRIGKPKRRRRWNEPTVVSIEFTAYATDDEETDWEGF